MRHDSLYTVLVQLNLGTEQQYINHLILEILITEHAYGEPSNRTSMAPRFGTKQESGLFYNNAFALKFLSSRPICKKVYNK